MTFEERLRWPRSDQFQLETIFIDLYLFEEKSFKHRGNSF